MTKSRTTNTALPCADYFSWGVRGSITAEYTVLLCLVAVGCSLAVIGLGAPLVRMFVAEEQWLMLAVP